MNILHKIGLSVASAYLRRCQPSVGRWRIINYFLPILRTDGAPLGERTIRTQYNFIYKADLGDWLGQYVYLTGTYEPPTARIISSLLSSGDTFIDVGANSGFFTLLASSCVGPSGKVISFEPVPAMSKRLLENLSLNSMRNVELHKIAISNSEGIISLFEGPEGHKGISSLRPINNSATTIKVNTRTLDSFSPSFNSVKLIKIDVEGAEQLALEGMTDIISRFHPYLIIEVTDEYLRPFGHTAMSLANKLTDVGYRMYAIRPEGLTPMHPSIAADEHQYNALFAYDNIPDHLIATH
ncbi:MAG: FkbM family methyltransferase [Gammaproteobacteria bacterium]|nr:FkbM family methyltransferase [Gammaproteobacteria bacterium]